MAEATDLDLDPMFVTVGEHEVDQCGVNSRITVEVNGSDVFSCAVRQLASPDKAIRGPIYMTTESCWSGYSEFTITSEWSEIVVTIPEQRWQRRWETVGTFLTELATANGDMGAHY